MKVAYIFKTNMASTFQLATMILPQLENNNHGVKVAGMFFFDDNIFNLSIVHFKEHVNLHQFLVLLGSQILLRVSHQV